MLEIYVQTLFGTVNISFNKLVRHLHENVKVITAIENIPSGTHVMVVEVPNHYLNDINLYTIIFT